MSPSKCRSARRLKHSPHSPGDMAESIVSLGPGPGDEGITTKARYLSTHRACSGNGPWKLGPSIVIVEIRDHIVIRIVICIEPDRFFETWPPIYRGQERPARDKLRLSELFTSLFSTCTKFRIVRLNFYLRVYPTLSSPNSKSFIKDISRAKPLHLGSTKGGNLASEGTHALLPLTLSILLHPKASHINITMVHLNMCPI
jgi:hypothetical protein